MTFHVPNEYRVRRGTYATTEANGNNGAFVMPHPNPASKLAIRIIASDEEGWEHVSVSLAIKRTPTWGEMCHVKDVFWDAEDAVMQLHPPRSDWVNNHPFVLHLWRPTAGVIPLPPSIMVGIAAGFGE